MNFFRNTTLLVFGILLVTACAEDEKPVLESAIVRPAKISIAEPAGEDSKRVFPGTIESAMQSDLAFRVGGQLEKLPALAGKRFKKGELLAELDDAEYRNALQDRQARYTLAKSQYEKIIKLREQNHVSPTEVDQAEANLEAADAALSVAKDNLKYTRLLAPFDGVVANLRIENHQVVNPHETVLKLRAEQQLDVRFSVPETLLGKLKRIEDPSKICVQVRFNAFPEKTYPACFREFESSPDRITRAYSVVHRVPKINEFTALPGMAVEVEIDLGLLLRNEFSEGVLVPLTAVFEENGQEYVWRVDSDGLVNKTPVKVSNIQGDQLLISNGLKPKEPVISVGVSYIQEGMHVRAMKKERGL